MNRSSVAHSFGLSGLVGLASIIVIGACSSGGPGSLDPLDGGPVGDASGGDGSRDGAIRDASGDVIAPTSGPFTCGTKTCTATQFCMNPCCGGPAPQCTPLPESGQCPVGTSPGKCVNGTTGCVEGACTPAPSHCVDSLPGSGSGCTVNPSTHQLTCLCA